jgi:excisionase family DNA binding protein
MNEDLLTVEEAANLKEVHVKTMYRIVSEGTVPHVRLWGRVLIRRADLDTWQPSRRIKQARQRREDNG